MKRSTLQAVTLLAATMPIITWSALAAPATQKKTTIAPPGVASTRARTPAPIGDGGGWETVDLGVDLVVSKVAFKRGTFGSDPAKRIQIIPYVKNMWRGRTTARIKILLSGSGVDMAEWIETGIGANEEKSGGALYVDDAKGIRALDIAVEVDNNNAIPETNDLNNLCEHARLNGRLRQYTHNCPITGPHEPLI
jgi:hypothetical protein